MPRKPFELNPSSFYHVTARTHNRQPFCVSLEDVWEIMQDYLYFVVKAFGLEISAFELMPNHFHLIVRAPNSNLSDAMRYFLCETSKRLGFRMGHINQLWGGRYYRCEIDSYQYYLHAYKYVYRNAIRASLAKCVEEYPYSTLYGKLGLSQIVIPVIEDTILFDDVEGTLRWLNQETPKDSENIIRQSLKGSKFILDADSENIIFQDLDIKFFEKNGSRMP